ncbi:heavy metal translocating P-type ATPase [Camelimonas lactis]|uniref:P-type Zn(2+) transporter n=1 Tax=Camelimonas lactis TaxID=659006 RepID=A0A4R2GPG7_9HYPH|nr:heavy metal translocating P-type ATPase [Camelimonas lactis]TCO11459.1 Cd2+/Zn2+-exporting ATPase [Camelimonas lactis]
MNAPAATRRYRVEGMDCAACALKIETAVQRLPGVTGVAVNVALQRLTIEAEAQPAAAEVAALLKRLGYAARPEPAGATANAAAHAHAPCCDGPGHHHGHDHAHEHEHQHGHAHDDHGKDHGADHGEDHFGHSHAPETAPSWFAARMPVWMPAGSWQTLLAMAIVAAAFVVAWIVPSWSRAVWSLATLIAVAPIARRAWAGAATGSPFTIETLLVVAAVGALLIGESVEAAAVVVLFNIGEMLEGVAAGRARAGVTALLDVVPRTALRDRNGTLETVGADALAVGDTVVVRPGDRAPSDGEILSGASDMNEAPVTGESTPVARRAGDKIYAGAINLTGELRVRITSAAADNTIARIIAMVEEAQEKKAPIERFINRFSRWYTPAAMAFAALVAILPPLLAGQPWETWIYRGLAVLLIACPCALVISTPAAIAAAIANGARRGLLAKGGATLETLAHVRTIAFDKTGTLTRGEPRVTNVTPPGGDDATPTDATAINAALAKAAAVEMGSNHPLGLAIIAEAEARGLTIPRTLDGSAATAGKGVSGRLDSGLVTVGSPRQARESGALPASADARVTQLESDGKTVVVVSEDGVALALIALRDEPRDDAAAGVAELKALGVTPVMLTGDNAHTAAAIGAALGLAVEAELLPGDKLAAIDRLQQAGPVAMVGDGINDAPALAAAAVGVAMGGGTDVALETADAALLRNRIGDVASLIRLARAGMGNIRQNLVIALGLKAAFLVTTLLGETPLWMAILADTGATVLVTANALRLLRLREA